MINLRSIKIPTLQDRKISLSMYTLIYTQSFSGNVHDVAPSPGWVQGCVRWPWCGDTAVAPGSAAGTALADPRHSDALGRILGVAASPLFLGCSGVSKAWLAGEIAAPWAWCSEGTRFWGSGMSGCSHGCSSLRSPRAARCERGLFPCQLALCSQRPPAPGSAGMGDAVC